MKRPKESSYAILLIGNNNQDLSKTIAQMIQGNGYRVTLVSSGKAAEEELNRRDFDLVITDLNWLLIGGKVRLKKAQALKQKEFLKAS